MNARWLNSVFCPNCGHDDASAIRGGKLFDCKDCRKQFTERVGAVMESSKMIEGFWSLVNRSSMGDYSRWSKAHLVHYISEMITQHQNLIDLPTFDSGGGLGSTIVRARMIMVCMKGQPAEA